MLYAYLEKLLPKVSTMKMAIPSELSNLVQSCLGMIQIFLNKDAIKFDNKEEADRIVNNYVAFSIIWSIGANIHDQDRSKFGSWSEQITEQYIFDRKQNFFEILVPTNDTVK